MDGSYTYVVSTATSTHGNFSVFPFWYYFDYSRSIKVYDDFKIVLLPAPCCQCISWEYFYFSEDGLVRISALNQAQSIDATYDTRIYTAYTATPDNVVIVSNMLEG